MPQCSAIRLHNPQSSGAVEKAVQDVADLAKIILLSLEGKWHSRLNVGLQWAKWLVRHAAFGLARCNVEEAGVHVVYGIVNYKVHSKIALVVRRDEDGLRRYVHHRGWPPT